MKHIMMAISLTVPALAAGKMAGDETCARYTTMDCADQMKAMEIMRTG